MKKKYYLSLVCSLILLLLASGYVGRGTIRTQVSSLSAHFHRVPSEAFPNSLSKELSPTQTKIVQYAKEEYSKHPVSYDEDVLKYTQGTKEAWCANFVSWVMNESGQPFKNPNSGSWRIPGVLTLKEYYEQNNQYETAGNYQPKVGDVAFYIGKHDFGLFDQQHVALVVGIVDQKMITLGGNDGGRMLLRTQTYHNGDNNLVGFGTVN